MKTIAALAATMFVFLMIGVNARAESSWGIQSVVVLERAWSKYVTVGGVNMYDLATANCDLAVTLKNGLYGEVWYSKSLNDAAGGNKGDEIDYTLAWDKKTHVLNWSLGVIYIDIIPSFRTSGDKVRLFAEIGKSLSFGAHQLSPFVRYDWNQPVAGKIPAPGPWVWVGVNDSWKFYQTLTLKSRAYLFYDNTKKEGVDAVFQTIMSWQATKKLSFEPFCLKLFKPVWKSPDKKFEHVEGAGLTCKF